MGVFPWLSTSSKIAANLRGFGKTHLPLRHKPLLICVQSRSLFIFKRGSSWRFARHSSSLNRNSFCSSRAISIDFRHSSKYWNIINFISKFEEKGNGSRFKLRNESFVRDFFFNYHRLPSAPGKYTEITRDLASSAWQTRENVIKMFDYESPRVPPSCS